MNQRIATNAIKLLNNVTLKRHTEREVMNEVITALMEIVNMPEAPLAPETED